MKSFEDLRTTIDKKNIEPIELEQLTFENIKPIVAGIFRIIKEEKLDHRMFTRFFWDDPKDTLSADSFRRLQERQSTLKRYRRIADFGRKFCLNYKEIIEDLIMHNPRRNAKVRTRSASPTTTRNQNQLLQVDVSSTLSRSLEILNTEFSEMKVQCSHLKKELEEKNIELHETKRELIEQKKQIQIPDRSNVNIYKKKWLEAKTMIDILNAKIVHMERNSNKK